MDLDRYSTATESFLTELDREYHLHFSGQKSDYAIEAIYERHADLFDRAAVEELRSARDSANGEERRTAEHLLEMAVGAYLGRACAAEEASLAAREAKLEIELDDGPIPYRSAPVEQANEADPERRQAIERGRMELLSEHLNPLHRAVIERSHALLTELGWRSYTEAFAELRGIDLAGLCADAGAFLAATDAVYEQLLEPQLEEVLGFGLDRVRRADLARFFRAPKLDGCFPEERLLPSFGETVAELGFDLSAQPNVLLDTERRPTKTPRAYCAPVRVPEEIYLVVPRVGGREDYAALFHEGGHALHYANMPASLRVAYRYLGDNSVTESFAFLLERITEERGWLERALSTESEVVTSHGTGVRLYFLRRYAAKLRYECELHGEGARLDEMPARYAELVGGATRIPWSEESWLDDVDPGFYVAAYLRAWALESRWRAELKSRAGDAWYRDPESGNWLRELWSQGQRLRADELLSERLGEQLRFSDLAAEFV